MSHFAVAVITDNLENLKGLLAPYQENNMGDCPKEYLEFNDMEGECRKGYETDTIEQIKMPDGRLLFPYDDEFRVDRTHGDWSSPSHIVPEDLERVKVSIKEKYPTFEQYVELYHGYKKDEETGRYGYWENPKAKWDWWTIGGRWSDSLLLKNGDQADFAAIKDIFFFDDPLYSHPQNGTVEIAGVHVTNEFAKEMKGVVEEAESEWDEIMAGKGFYKPEYFVQRYGTKEAYVKESLSFGTYAVITSDGVWHAKGEMGWFGMSSESPEEAREFSSSYYETFIKNANPDHFLIVVDCHI